MNTYLLNFARLALIAIVSVLSHQELASQGSPFNYDYSQTLVMKMMNAVPDGKGGSKVYINFENALSIIKEVDQLTLGVPKIIYLTGWQYTGHDDLYPAFFEVNKALKRPRDESAKQSLVWLIREAKKYNTRVSLHINMTDAYNNSPMWNDYVANDLISKNADGTLMAIGFYNNLKSYQINYRNEWEHGFAQKRIDSLLSLLPELKDVGTIHIDAWIARDSKGHGEGVDTEIEYQKKICNYWINKGIDPTSEWEMDYMTGLVPYYWHFNHHTQEEYLRIPANICTGSHMNPDVKKSDFDLEFLFGTSMYGQFDFPSELFGQWGFPPDWKNASADDWEKKFNWDFYLNFPQYYYLNRLKRLSVDGEEKGRVAYYSNNVRVAIADSTVYENNRLLRKGNTICFPALWREDNSLVAYSEKACELLYTLPESWKGVQMAETYLVTKNGLVRKKTIEIRNELIKLTLEAGLPLIILPVINNNTKKQ